MLSNEGTPLLQPVEMLLDQVPVPFCIAGMPTEGPAHIGPVAGRHLPRWTKAKVFLHSHLQLRILQILHSMTVALQEQFPAVWVAVPVAKPLESELIAGVVHMF